MVYDNETELNGKRVYVYTKMYHFQDIFVNKSIQNSFKFCFV